MRKSHPKLIDLFLVSLASLALMAYGWYLGQLHQSGYDVAGIFLFIAGVLGLMLALLVRYLTRKHSWYSNLLTGLLSCTIIFAVILLLARLHG